MKGRWARLSWIAGLTVLADQATKQIILKKVPLFSNLEVIPGFFSITHVRNTGGAFGLFAGQPTDLRTAVFLIISLAALGAVLCLYSKTARGDPLSSTAFCLIFGGALGNLIDRVRFGSVVDFLDFYVGSAHWPAFNVADSAISVGVGLLFLQVIFGKGFLDKAG